MAFAQVRDVAHYSEVADSGRHFVLMNGIGADLRREQRDVDALSDFPVLCYDPSRPGQ